MPHEASPGPPITQPARGVTKAKGEFIETRCCVYCIHAKWGIAPFYDSYCEVDSEKFSAGGIRCALFESRATHQN